LGFVGAGAGIVGVRTGFFLFPLGFFGSLLLRL
jgi:hypothetical protein